MWWFFRGLGLVTLSAFVSLHVQVLGLYGEHGIVPVTARLARWLDRVPDVTSQWLERPTIFLLCGASDRALSVACLVGELAALALTFGVLGGPAALLSFVIYASFVNVGAPFLPLQWDTLLCETLVLAAFAAPWRTVWSRFRDAPEPLALPRYAIVFLLARLMFASGVVKLQSGDPTWRDLSALTYHFETQPLPNALSPFAHSLPESCLAAFVVATFFAELVAPLLVLVPDVRFHRAFAISTIALMSAIAATGNYGFFNALTVVLTVPLLAGNSKPQPTDGSPRSHTFVPSVFAAVMMTLGASQLVTSLGAPRPDAVDELIESLAPFRLTSSYGLFAVMTRRRPELVIEATEDGARWEPYELPYKPGDAMRAPPIVPLHMPRLDWMLWFAALSSDAREVPWIASLTDALLKQRPEVLARFSHVPFQGRPPRAVRIVRWQYRFVEGNQEGRVWTRSEPELWAMRQRPE